MWEGRGYERRNWRDEGLERKGGEQEGDMWVWVGGREPEKKERRGG